MENFLAKRDGWVLFFRIFNKLNLRSRREAAVPRERSCFSGSLQMIRSSAGLI